MRSFSHRLQRHWRHCFITTFKPTHQLHWQEESVTAMEGRWPLRCIRSLQVSARCADSLFLQSHRPSYCLRPSLVMPELAGKRPTSLSWGAVGNELRWYMADRALLMAYTVLVLPRSTPMVKGGYRLLCVRGLVGLSVKLPKYMCKFPLLSSLNLIS